VRQSDDEPTPLRLDGFQRTIIRLCAPETNRATKLYMIRVFDALHSYAATHRRGRTITDHETIAVIRQVIDGMRHELPTPSTIIEGRWELGPRAHIERVAA
jgi:hypothetical protein